MEYDEIEGGWVPSALNWGDTNYTIRKGRVRPVANVFDFLGSLENVAKIKSPQGQHEIMMRYWDVQGHLLNPGLNTAQKRYVKRYMDELKRYMTPANRKAIRNERRIMTLTKSIIKPRLPSGVRAALDRWDDFQEAPLNPRNVTWLYNLNRTRDDDLNRAFAEAVEEDEQQRTASYQQAFKEAVRIWKGRNPEHRGRLPMGEIHKIVKTIWVRRPPLLPVPSGRVRAPRIHIPMATFDPAEPFERPFEEAVPRLQVAPRPRMTREQALEKARAVKAAKRAAEFGPGPAMPAVPFTS